MTPDILLLFALLAVMVYFFLSEKLPVDLTAFLGLLILILAGYLTAEEGFSGFASPAVITMISVFVLSGGLLNTGVADVLGNRIHAWLGSHEVVLIPAVMIITALLSSFMPNVAATVVLMPAAAALARLAGLSPSRLFMPLSFSAILGGTITSVGTTPNILAVSLMQERNMQEFGLFEFAPLGLILFAAGTVYMVVIGRKFLPQRDLSPAATQARELAQVYGLHRRVFSIRIPEGSPLDGATLEQSRLGTALGVQVIAILRGRKRNLAPRENDLLRSGDLLMVEGEPRDIEELLRVQGVEVTRASPEELPRPVRGVSGVRLRLPSRSPLIGRSLRELRFREQFGLVVVAIERNGQIVRERLAGQILRESDEILALGTQGRIQGLAGNPDFLIQRVGLSAVQQLQEDLFIIRIPDDSPLVGATVASSRIGELAGITVGGIIREDQIHLAISPDETIQAGDRLLIAGEPSRIINLLELGEVQLDRTVAELTLESEEVGVVEAAISPRSTLADKTLEELRFRQRYGLQVLSIWREGQIIHTNLGLISLRFGDALLLQGPREKIELLAGDPDFIVLSQLVRAPRRKEKAPFAVLGLLLMVFLLVSGLLPIHVASFSGALLVLLAGSLTMEEAYRFIDWRSIFLVGALIPVGSAVEASGAALLIANGVIDLAAPWGDYVILSTVAMLSSLLSQTLDPAVAVVLLTPVVIETARELGINARALIMAITLAASIGFMTPFSAKTNLLVMGAGGYRSRDFVRVGTLLTILLLVILVLVVPLFFPL